MRGAGGWMPASPATTEVSERAECGPRGAHSTGEVGEKAHYAVRNSAGVFLASRMVPLNVPDATVFWFLCGTGTCACGVWS